ncbi:MAG: ATPase [Chromatiales bacterium]|jgi:V/A-type H+-transporting ATPase subunit I|nr:ATPase [Chromatiales bacterium]PLX54809.1 MAG: ATPase [Chromatiales bacterium]
MSGLRPYAARWFELLVPREVLTDTLQQLAKTRSVELEAHSTTSAPLDLPDLHSGLQEYSRLATKYGHYWPQPQASGREVPQDPEIVLEKALATLQRWEKSAEPLIVELQKRAQEKSDLELIADFLGVPAQLPDLDAFAGAGPTLAATLFLVPEAAVLAHAPPSVLLQRVTTATRNYLLVVGPTEQVAELRRSMEALRAREILLPHWLPAQRPETNKAVKARVDACHEESAKLLGELQQINDSTGLAAALRDIELLEWLVRNVPSLPLTEHFAWITGWTSDPDAATLEARLEDAGIPHLLRLPDEMPDVAVPTVLRNPVWIRPFELFARMLGTPSAAEVDPSRIVAFAAPLMFGYMFGDVGQGLVLLLAGLMLRKRVPTLGLLVPGGAMSIVFGFVFGSVFSREDIIPALWLHPLDQPVPVLVVTLVFGAALLTLGLLFDALQYWWRGMAPKWLGSRAGLLVCYIGLVAAPFAPAALWAMLAGAIWFIAGGALTANRHRLAALGTHAAELLESLMQLLVNTISFVRVGAFALAHAGLAAAVVGVSEAASGIGYLLLMIIGNAIVIALEGLVVGIQTTRLVLFEFFVRFLRGEGRLFRPLPPPPNSSDSAIPRKTP